MSGRRKLMKRLKLRHITNFALLMVNQRKSQIVWLNHLEYSGVVVITPTLAESSKGSYLSL